MIARVGSFDEWREEARRALRAGVDPNVIAWSDARSAQIEIAIAAEESVPILTMPPATAVPRRFLEMAKHVSCHREPMRWALLYRVLWRVTHGERALLDIATDAEVRRCYEMDKQVRHDLHKMHAFVRFRKAERNGEDWFIAWHRPDHYIVRLAAPFFQERFSQMSWAILTPDDSVEWDTRELRFLPGSPREHAPLADELENLWRGYYRSTFNPARVNLPLMRQHMAQRHWATLPETADMHAMLCSAEARVDHMLKENEEYPTAQPFLPNKLTLPAMRDAVQACRGCPLYKHATQAVFGEGLKTARLVLIGEQPGDAEDIAGKPFVGPAGQLLDGVLEEAGIDRKEAYVTNAVKHFKFTQERKRRLHQKPNRREMDACEPWLIAEMEVLKPSVIVALGATAAAQVFGAGYKLTQQRGQVAPSKYCERSLGTWHPSAVLRSITPEDRAAKRSQMVDDLRRVAEFL